MAAKQQDQRRLVAQIAAATRWGNDDATNARRDLIASRLEQHIRRVVSSVPALSSEQLHELANLLAQGEVASSE